MEGYQLLGEKDPEVLAVDMCADIIRKRSVRQACKQYAKTQLTEQIVRF